MRSLSGNSSFFCPWNASKSHGGVNYDYPADGLVHLVARWKLRAVATVCASRARDSCIEVGARQINISSSDNVSWIISDIHAQNNHSVYA